MAGGGCKPLVYKAQTTASRAPSVTNSDLNSGPESRIKFIARRSYP